MSHIQEWKTRWSGGTAAPWPRAVRWAIIGSCVLAVTASMFSTWGQSAIESGRTFVHTSLEAASHASSGDSSQKASPHRSSSHWVDAWGTAPETMPIQRFVPSPLTVDGPPQDYTIRQTVKLTIDVERIRLRFSNEAAQGIFPVARASVALPKYDPAFDWERDRLDDEEDKVEFGILGSQVIDVASLQEVTVGESPSFIISARAAMLSDPIEFNPPLKAGQVLTVNLYMADKPTGEDFSGHWNSLATSYFAPGDQTASAALSDSIYVKHWYTIEAIEAWKDETYGSFVILGDSITDGSGSRADLSASWVSTVARRMRDSGDAKLSKLSVVNSGQGGDEVMRFTRTPGALARVERDVLGHSGVKYVMLAEGINDIGSIKGDTAAQWEGEARLIRYLKQIIARVHTFGLPVVGATITPFHCHDGRRTNKYNKFDIHEEIRVKVNDWIRNSGFFDAVVDFDEAIRNPLNATKMDLPYDSGDCLHPGPEGHKKMGESFPLDIFNRLEGLEVWE